MSNAALTQKVLRELEHAALTPSGSKAVLLALDPAHDSKLDVVGLPNSASGKSVVYDVCVSMTVTKPATFPEGNWDCNVAWMGDIRGGVGAPGVIDLPLASYHEHDTGVGLSDGIIVAASCPSDWGYTFDCRDVATNTNQHNQGLSISSYVGYPGRYQIVGAVFEVANTTAPLYKQGNVTCYRFENNTVTKTFKQVDSSTEPVVKVPAYSPSRMRTLPPSTLANAKELGGLTWEAERGCMVPVILGSLDVPPGALGPFPILHNASFATNGQACGFASDEIMAYGRAPLVLDFDTDTSGAYFTGLSDETVLTVTAKIYLETFLPPRSPLVSLAHDSPPLDSAALQMINRLQRDLNPGYPLVDNDFGDFFRGIASSISRVAKPLASAMRFVAPVVPLAGKAAKVTDMVAKITAKAGKKKKAAKKNVVDKGMGRVVRK